MVPDHGFARVGTMQVQAIMPPSKKMYRHFPNMFHGQVKRTNQTSLSQQQSVGMATLRSTVSKLGAL